MSKRKYVFESGNFRMDLFFREIEILNTTIDIDGNKVTLDHDWQYVVFCKLYKLGKDEHYFQHAYYVSKQLHEGISDENLLEKKLLLKNSVCIILNTAKKEINHLYSIFLSVEQTLLDDNV